MSRNKPFENINHNNKKAEFPNISRDKNDEVLLKKKLTVVNSDSDTK